MFRLIPCRLVMVALVALSTVRIARAADPVLSTDDAGFLHDQATRLATAAKMLPAQTVGGFRNETPYTLRVPGGNMGYPAFWVRDTAMMLGDDFIPADEIEGWIRLITSTLRGPEAWNVRPDVVVPAFAVPDHINFNGMPTFYPGNYETGDKQGGTPWGKYPPLDDNFFFLRMVFEQWKLSHNLSFFQSSIKTSFGEMKLSDLCLRVYNVAPIDATTGLCIAGDLETENAKDWGFCDAESKSGQLLFPSILRFVAAGELEELFSASGDHKAAAAFLLDRNQIRASLSKTFFHASDHDNEGWLHSATGVCNQADVWGSAYAVYSGAVDDETSIKIAKALARAYREQTTVRNGCVRHLLATDPLKAGQWERSISALGDYQNGGYWGTPTGWYIAAMSKIDHHAACDMATDFIRYLRENHLPDGTAEACEWINPEMSKKANPLYAATVVLPYVTLQQAGLLPPAIINIKK